MKTRHVHTISTDDVGARYLRIEGRSYPATDFIGRILSGDVGKRVYLVGEAEDGILQVENDEQRDKRLREERP